MRASKPKRSLSDSQPQLTASASTPSTRSTRLRDACTATLAPTLSTQAVDSVSVRSQGRALKRYGAAVSAPTGQICTVLPEKYEAKGSPVKVLTSVWLPRPMKWMRASPATSSAKRVQQSHRMQRSRSR